MKENPANALKDTMWKFLMDKGQKSNIPALKEYVYDLIQMTTQKTAGQRKIKDRPETAEEITQKEEAAALTDCPSEGRRLFF